MAVPDEQTANDEQFMTGALNIARGVTWFGIGIIAGSLLEYVTQAFVAVKLGPDNFGLFSLGQRVTLIIVTFAALAMPNVATYFIPRIKVSGENRERDRLISFTIWLPFVMSIIVGIVLFLIADFIAVSLLDEPRLTIILKLFAFTIPTWVTVLILVGNLRGLTRSRQASLLTSTYERSFRLAFVVLLFTLGLGLSAPILAYLIAGIIVCGLGIYYLKQAGIVIRLDLPELTFTRQIFIYSSPLLISQVINQSLPSIQPLLLARFYDARLVGLYSITWLIGPSLFAMVAAAFGFLYVPVISELVSSGDDKSLARLYRIVTKWQLIVVLPLYLLMISLSSQILSLFGSEYIEATRALIILSTGSIFSISFGQVGTTLIATGNTGVYMFLNLLGIVVSVTIGLLIIPTLGLLGAAIGYSSTIMFWNTSTWFVVYRKFGIHPFGREFFVIILTALASLIPVYPVSYFLMSITPWFIFAITPLYSLLYVFLLIRFDLLDEDSQKIVKQFMQIGLNIVKNIIDFLLKRSKGE